MKKHLGSTIALVIGVLSVISGISILAKPSNIPDLDTKNILDTGIIIILGALAYRSAKKRKLGTVKSTILLQCYEIAAICIAVAIVMLKSNLKYRIATEPVLYFLMLWVVIAYIIISFKTSKKITAGLAIFIILFITVMVLKENEPVVKTEKDMQYLIDSIDAQKGLDPKAPQNEFQQSMSDYMIELTELNTNTTSLTNNIGPIEFASFEELKERQRVITLKDNLKKYWYVRQFYYDKVDALLKKYKNKRKYGSDNTGRLEGTVSATLEKLEEKYFIDLTNFYDFVLKRHERMTFTKDQIYIENEKLVDELNSLWRISVESATNMTSFQEKSAKTMRNAVEELKKQNKNNDIGLAHEN